MLDLKIVSVQLLLVMGFSLTSYHILVIIVYFYQLWFMWLASVWSWLTYNCHISHDNTSGEEGFLVDFMDVFYVIASSRSW